MKKLIAVLTVLSLFLPLTQADAQTTSSIRLNQSNPVYGDSVNFTEVYPRIATRQARHPQYPNNPATQLDCYQGNVRVYQNLTGIVSQKNNGDGTLTGITGYLIMGGSSNGLIWTSGAASCYATLFYVDVGGVIHVLATLQFDVAA